MENTKINLEETLANYKRLVKKGFLFIARSESGELKVFIKKPIKELNFWCADGELPHPINGNLFDHIEWCDKEPVSITKAMKKLKKDLQIMEKNNAR